MKLDGIWIGDLDRLLVIESPTTTTDSTSSQRKITGWTEFKKVWGKRDQSSKEDFEVAKQVANNSGKWFTRFISGVDETMRVNDKGEYHYILGIQRVDRDSYLVLTTEKRDG